MEIIGNHAIEAAAIAFVEDLERVAGREPRDTRRIAAEPVDLVAGDRLIEVKAFGRSSRGADLWLEPAQHAVALTDARFHLYLVENVRQGDPAQFRLIDLHGERLQRLMARAKERQYWTLPWPVAEYDEATGDVGGQ